MRSLSPERFGYGEDPLELERENLGNSVDIYYFRTKLIHVLLQDPSLTAAVYRRMEELIEVEVAERVERTGLRQFFGRELWGLDPDEREEILRSVVFGNEALLMRGVGLGIPDSLTFLEEEKSMRLRVSESLEAYNLPRLKRPICFMLSGVLAGAASGRLGDYVAYEEKCIAEGHDYCEFFIGPSTPYIGKMRNYLDMPFSGSKAFQGIGGSMVRGAGGAPDYSVLREHFVNTTLRALQYLGGEARPELGKKFHLFPLQQHNLGMLSSSPEAPDRMRDAGMGAGASLARVGLTSGYNGREMVALLPELLMRTGMGLVELFRTDDGYEVVVSECAEATGVVGEERVCPFETGFFAGFFGHLEDVEVEGEEVRCSATGGDVCVHRVSRLGDPHRLLELSEMLEWSGAE